MGNNADLSNLSSEQIDQLTNIDGPLADVHMIANQLGKVVDGSFDFEVDVTSDNPVVQKLGLVANFLLETIRQNFHELEQKNNKLSHLINEQQRTLQLLQEAELRTASITNHVYVTRINQDETLENLYISPNIEGLTGYPLEKFETDWSFWSETVICPDDRAVAARHMKRLRQGIAGELEYRLVKADGTIIWVADSAQVIDGEDGSRTIYGVVADISERKAAENEADRFRAIIEATSDFVAIGDTEGKNLFINQAGRQMLGIASDEDISDTSMLDYYPKENAQLLTETVLPCASEMGVWRGENVLLSRNGQEIPISQVIIAHKSQEGTEAYFSTIARDISAQKQLQRELEQQRSYLKQVIDINPHFIFAKDKQGRFTLANEAFAQAYGTEPEQLIGKKDSDFNPHSELVERYNRDDLTVIETGQELFIEEEQVVNIRGKKLWRKTVKRPIVDETGKPVEVLGVATDITALKRTQAELHEQEQFLRLIIDNMPGLVFWKDTQLRYLGGNKKFAAVAGVSSPEDLVGKTDFDLAWTPAEARAFRADDQQVIETGTPKHNIVEPQHQADGNLAWLATNKIPLYDAEGSSIGILGTTEDITERIEAERALRHSQERLETFVRALPDITFIIDEHGNYLEVMADETNPMYDGAAEQLRGQRIFEVVPKDTAQLIMETIRRTLDIRKMQIIEYELPVKEHTRWFEARVTPIRTDEGDARQAVLVARDITSQKQAEKALVESQRSLETLTGNLPGMAYRSLNDERWTMTFVSEGARALTGYEVDELISNEVSYEDLLHPDDAEIVREQTLNALQKQERLQTTYRLRTKDGEEKWVWEQRLGIFENEELVALEGLALDITDRVRLEEQVKESLERRGRQVYLATQIAQELVGAADIDKIYQQVVTQVKEQFGFYHVQLFLYDQATAQLKLQSGYGAVGRQMLEEGYSLSLADGVAGAAAALGSPVLEADLSQRPSWQPHPLLGEARGQIAVPIKQSEVSVEAQITALTYFVEQDFDGIIVAATDPTSVAPVTSMALAQNKVVIAPVVDLGDANQTALVVADEYRFSYLLGSQAGQWAEQTLPAGDHLEMAWLCRSNLASAQWEAGIMAGLREVFGSNIKVVGSEIVDSASESFTVSQQLLEQHPDLKMILVYDDDSAMEVYRAVSNAGLNTADRFFVGSIGVREPVLDAIKQRGAFQSTVYVPPKHTGAVAVRSAVAAILGEEHQTTVEVGCIPVDITNIDNFANQASDLKGDLGPFVETDLNHLRIGLSVFDLNSSFFRDLVDGAMYEAERLGVQLFVNDPKPVIGVLDIQANEVNVLDYEDQLLLEGLSGQLAAAIQNIQLLEEARIFRQFTEASGQGMGFAKLDGEIVYINPTFANILEENDAEQVIGRSIFPYYPEHELPKIQDEIIPTVMRDEQWRGELPIRTAKGKIIPAIQNYSLLRDNKGNPRYIANVATDITDRKKAESELEARVNELNALQRMMSREGWQAYQFAHQDQMQGYLFDQIEAKPITVDPAIGDDLTLDVSQIADAESGSSVRARPITLSGEVIGELGVYDDPDSPLLPEDQEFLITVADQVAEALERARLLEQTHKRAIELEAVAQVGTVASNTLEVDKLLNTVVNLTKQRFGLYHAHIYLLNEAENVLELTSGAGEVGKQLVQQSWRINRDEEHSLVALAVRTREGVIANDVRSEPDYLPNPLLPDTRSELAVPLIVGDKVIGVLDVQSDVVNRFTAEDVQIKTTLATQVAVALENARLFEEERAIANEIEEQAGKLAILNQISAEFNQAVTVEEVFNIAAARINQFINTDRGTIGLLDQSGQYLNIYMLQGVNGALLTDQRIPLKGSLLGATLQQGRPVNIPDLTTTDYLETATLAEQGLKSALLAPLFSGGRAIGVLKTASTAAAAYDDRDERLLVQTASLIGTTIESRRLLEQTQAALAETETLYDLVGMLSAANTLDEVLQIAVSPAEHANYANLFTIEVDNRNNPAWMTLIASWDIDGQQKLPIGMRLNVEDFAISNYWIERFDEPLLIEDVTKDERFNEASLEIYRQVESVATVFLPLTINDRWIGVVSLNWPEAKAFTEKDRRLYQSIASQTAVVVNNLMLLEQTQASLTQSELLYTTISRINEAGSLTEVLAAVANVGAVYSIDRATVFDYEHDVNGVVQALVVREHWASDSKARSRPVGRRYTLAEHPIFTLALGTEALFFDDLMKDTRIDERMRAMLEEEETRAQIMLPLRTSGHQRAVLVLESPCEYQFTERDKQLYVTIAPQISAALENQRLLKETQNALAEVEAVQKRYTVQAWEAYQEVLTTLGYEQQDGETKPLGNGTRLKVSASEQQEPALSNDSNELSTANVTVPIKVRDEIVGILGAEANESQVWSEEELALVEAIAEELALAAENIRLLDESQTRAAREHRVNEITEKIQAAQTLEEALQVAVKEVGLSLRAPETSIELDISE